LIQIEASLEEKMVEVTYVFLQCRAITLSGTGIYAQDTSCEVINFIVKLQKSLELNFWHSSRRIGQK